MITPARNDYARATTRETRRTLSILFLNWRDSKHPEAGGAERYLLEVGRRFREHGHEVHWLTAGFAGASSEDVIDGMRITRVGNRASVYLAIPWAFVRRFRGRFDAIVDAENGIPFFSPLFSTVTKVCLVHHVHQRVFERHLPFPASGIFKWLERELMPRVYAASRFIAVSSDTKRELIELGVPSEKISLAYGGYDVALRPGIKAETPTIVFLGRLKAYKRVDLLLRGMVEIRRSVPNASLVIAGSGDREASLRALAKTLGIAEAVHFEGFVTEDRKRELLAAAWVFAISSEMEGWGLTIIEANACGTPAVGISVPGIREAIVDGVSGVLVADGTQLGAALVRILRDAELRERLSRGAIERATEFTWERTSQAILDALAP